MITKTIIFILAIQFLNYYLSESLFLSWTKFRCSSNHILVGGQYCTQVVTSKWLIRPFSCSIAWSRVFLIWRKREFNVFADTGSPNLPNDMRSLIVWICGLLKRMKPAVKIYIGENKWYLKVKTTSSCRAHKPFDTLQEADTCYNNRQNTLLPVKYWREMQQLILFLLSQQCEQPIIAVELVTSTYTQIHQQKFKNFKHGYPSFLIWILKKPN